MTKLYISGPMTGIKNHNFPAFDRAERLLVHLGFEVSNPATKGIVDGWSWEDYLKWDLHEVLRVDGIATLSGHNRSKGACLETYVARRLKIPVHTLSWWVLRSEL